VRSFHLLFPVSPSRSQVSIGGSFRWFRSRSMAGNHQSVFEFFCLAPPFPFSGPAVSVSLESHESLSFSLRCFFVLRFFHQTSQPPVLLSRSPFCSSRDFSMSRFPSPHVPLPLPFFPGARCYGMPPPAFFSAPPSILFPLLLTRVPSPRALLTWDIEDIDACHSLFLASSARSAMVS